MDTGGINCIYQFIQNKNKIKIKRLLLVIHIWEVEELVTKSQTGSWIQLV